MTFVFANGDPGMDLLSTEARGSVRNLQKRNALSIEVVSGADHTFTPPEARQRLINYVIGKVAEHRC